MLALPAQSETRTSVAVVPVASTLADPLAGAPPCTATFCKSIVRYQNKGLIAVTEYNTAYPCKYIDHGTWTPGTGIQPTDKGTPAGTVDVSQPAFKGPTPPGCADSGGPYYYKPIYFKWTLRKNLTAVSHYGPTAAFSSNWKTKDGQYDIPYSFQITVPVVRPKGEKTQWAGWNNKFLLGVSGTVGEWIQTLEPPDDDKSFDFSGETVRERFIGGSGSCPIPPVPRAGQTSKGSSWPVESGNKWGPDGVGFGDEADSLCAIVYAQCIKTQGLIRLSGRPRVRSSLEPAMAPFSLQGARAGPRTSITSPSAR
jgi:hypothetical protein